MTISIFAAMDKKQGLGLENKLPWHLPDDLKRFKAITKGHTVIMGRKTFESIGKPLPDRKNIILTRKLTYATPPGCIVVNSMDEALKQVDNEDEVFIIGGAEIYMLGLSYANKMYLTFVDADVPVDAYFPDFDESEWNATSTESHPKDEKHPYAFEFKIYEKK